MVTVLEQSEQLPMMRYSAPARFISITLAIWPGQLPGFSHLRGPPGFAAIACLHWVTDTTWPFILAQMSRIRSSLPPQPQRSRPTLAPFRSGKGMVTITPPVVLVVGASMLQALPVKGPPMMISPYSPSMPPAISMRSSTLMPTGISMKQRVSVPPLSLPRTEMFL